MTTFSEFCNLNTVLGTNVGFFEFPNIVYYDGWIYGGRNESGGGSFIYRFDTNFNSVILTSSNFDTVRSIAVDSTGVYWFSAEEPTKIFSCPLLFTSTDVVSVINLTGTTIPLFNGACYLCKTTTDFYISLQIYIYKIPINTNVVSLFTTLPGYYNPLQIDNDSEILYILNNNAVTLTIYSINMTTGAPTSLSQIDDTLMNSSYQIAIYNGNIYFQYKNNSEDYILGIYNISGNSFINLITNISTILSGITINTNDNTMYVRETNSDLIIESTSYCFNKGTKILCMNKQLEDEYIAIELLKIGDFVKTYNHDYRKVRKVITGKLKNNPKKWNMCMYKMAKTETNGLIEDLIVTGGHSLLVDEISDEEHKKYDEMGISYFSKITIDNKRLLLSSVSSQFVPMQDREVYTYYHLLLESNDDKERFGIWANGVLTETPNEKTVNKIVPYV